MITAGRGLPGTCSRCVCGRGEGGRRRGGHGASAHHSHPPHSTHISPSTPQVDVFNPATQRTYYFPCNQWLEKTGASDAGCRKELLVGGAGGDETRCKYKVRVKGGRGRWERQLLEPPYICAGCLTLMYCPALITYVLPYAG